MILSFVAIPFILNLTDPVKDKTSFIEPIEIKGETFYLYNSSNSSSGYGIMKQPEDTVIEGNYFVEYRTDYTFIFLIVASSLLFLIVVVMTLYPDEEVNWDFKWSRTKSMVKKVDLEIEDNIYYYYVKDRLIHKSDLRLTEHEVRRHLKNYISTPNLYPKIKTKAMQRRDKIKSITS